LLRYEVKFQSPLECGGAYIKLLAEDAKFNLVYFAIFIHKIFLIEKNLNSIYSFTLNKGKLLR
jgi:hypothetical protein